MSTTSDSTQDEGQPGTDRQADAMKRQLNEEVAAWNKHRDEPSGDSPAARLTPSEPKPRRAGVDKKKAVQAQPAVQPGAVPAPAASKPFSMSYDGQSQSDYLRSRLDRKSR